MVTEEDQQIYADSFDDNEGYILSVRQGQLLPKEPAGVPFLWVDIPQGKQLKITDGIGVNVNVTPHEAILDDIPLSEIEELKNRISIQDETIATQEQAIAELSILFATK